VQAAEAAAIDKYNAALVARLEVFRAAHPDIEAVYVDTAPAFNEALGNPTKYGASDATCYNGNGVSCLWFNDYHPGVAINRLVAEAVAAAWKGKGWFR
jgi:phospholipase/lecithinase/hemolysin